MNIEFGYRRTLTDMINYVTDVGGHRNKHVSDPVPFVAGFGLDPNRADQDMLALKLYHDKINNRPYWQIEVSLENTQYNNFTANVFYNIGLEIYKWSECQLLMAVHTNTYEKNHCIHCHYILNSVKITGKMMTLNKYPAREQLKDIIDNVLRSNGFEPVNVPHNKQCQAS